jgi:hypothetical protein
MQNKIVGIKDIKTSLTDFVRTCEAIDRGEKVKREITPSIEYDKILLDLKQARF